MALAHLKDHGALKSDAIELDAVGSDQNGIDSPSGKKNSDYDDRQHMHRLGKAQLFDRTFRFLSILAFSLIAQDGWVFVPNNATSALIDGDTGGTIVMYLVNFAAFSTIIVSLAEMSSMAPTAGGQYHWASEFAPSWLQKPLSYLAGWLSCLAWCCGTSSGIYMTGTLIQAVVSILHEGYTPTAWKAYVIELAMVALTAFVNTYLARKLPMLEGVFFFLTIMGFVTNVIVLWVLGTPNRPSASAVFQTFSNEGGWSSLGLSMMAGQELLVWVLTGSDSTVHMAEETRNASAVVPRAMLWSYFVNGIMNFIMLVTYCFSYKDLQNISADPSGFQFVQAFALATGSNSGGAALTCVLIVLNAFAVFNFTASTSRQIFAFARDYGLPGHVWLAKVDTRTNTPVYAIAATLGFSVLITLISLGSSVAFSAITSVQLFALVFTYGITIGSLIWRRLRGQTLPRGSWTLGSLGLPINLIAVAYSAYLIVFIAFPVVIPVTRYTLNWSPVIFAGVVLLASVYYVVYARKKYDGPEAYVRSLS